MTSPSGCGWRPDRPGTNTLMVLVLLLVLLIIAAGYGGLALSPLLWILFAVLIVALFIGPGVSGAGWGSGRYRRW